MVGDVILYKGKCKVDFKEHGLEISGPCAEGFASAFQNIYKASKEASKEISAYACVNPKIGSVEKVVLGKIGTSTETSLPYGRVCPPNQRQVSMHTHPVSGIAKFSERDAVTITGRMNKGVDDVSCVIGEDVTQCFIRALIPSKKSQR